jgi:hypothetical protein
MAFTEQQLAKVIEDLEAIHYLLEKAVTNEMYQDPFWSDRYGRRGVDFTHQDVAYGLNFLITALKAESRDVLVRYYAWLRDLLVLRGMCTRHIWQTIHCTELALEKLLPMDTWELIAPYTMAGYGSLTYSAPTAVQLADHIEMISLSALALRNSSFHSMNIQEEFRIYLSYLADSVERNNRSLLIQFLSWKIQFNAKQPPGGQSQPSNPITEDLQALRKAIYQNMHPKDCRLIMKILDPAIQSVDQ